MMLRFTKMHGCGNDYIYINCFEQNVNSPESLSAHISDRHKGIGGDGVVLICPSDTADAKMRMFNADGSEGKMCGNAIRCVAKYLYDNGIVSKKRISVETASGINELELFTRNNMVFRVTVDMGRAELNPKLIPVKLDLPTVVNKRVRVAGGDYNITCVSMGNPHCVIFENEIESLLLDEIGPCFETDPLFPERVNTEFIEVIDSHTLKMRVWERGSGETLACGTGACAAVTAAVLNGICESGTDIRVILMGGELTVSYTPERILMTGPAEKVFEGVIEL